MDTTAAEAAGGLKFCDYYQYMSYADFLKFAASKTPSFAISERVSETF